MRKVIKNSIETSLENNFGSLQFGWWDNVKEEFVPLEDEESYTILGDNTGLSKEALSSLEMFAADINDRLNALNEDIKELASKVL